jgi:hypothetical protein
MAVARGVGAGTWDVRARALQANITPRHQSSSSCALPCRPSSKSDPAASQPHLIFSLAYSSAEPLMPCARMYSAPFSLSLSLPFSHFNHRCDPQCHSRVCLSPISLSFSHAAPPLLCAGWATFFVLKSVAPCVLCPACPCSNRDLSVLGAACQAANFITVLPLISTLEAATSAHAEQGATRVAAPTHDGQGREKGKGNGTVLCG